MNDSGDFNGRFGIDHDLLKFCLMGLIQKELDKAKATWNAHRIRPVHNSEVLAGIPNHLYDLLELEGASNYLIPISPNEIDELESFVSRPQPVADNTLQLFQETARLNNIPLDSAKSINDGILMYGAMKEAIESLTN